MSTSQRVLERNKAEMLQKLEAQTADRIEPDGQRNFENQTIEVALLSHHDAYEAMAEINEKIAVAITVRDHKRAEAPTKF